MDHTSAHHGWSTYWGLILLCSRNTGPPISYTYAYHGSSSQCVCVTAVDIRNMGHRNQALTRNELSLCWVHAAVQAPRSTGLPETHTDPCSNWYSFSHLDNLSLCTHSPLPAAPDTLPCPIIHYKCLMFNLDYSKHNLSLPIAKPPCLSVWMSTRGDVHTLVVRF